MDMFIVTIEDGIAQSMYSMINGKEIDITNQLYKIDYDNLNSGDCPVCGYSVVDNNQYYFCPECGYSTQIENALECAKRYWSGIRLVTYGKLISI